MKRTELLRHLTSNGCEFNREGKKHTIYKNRAAKKVSSIPRHNEIKDSLVRKICKDLGVAEP
ncbi:MAG: type II toxin-antitoxin system HicA family toxin [Acidobacteria bacterium]|nr:type II toxin-antitoxin system HicA family toxin [Acidobacteriota bacterium]